MFSLASPFLFKQLFVDQQAMPGAIMTGATFGSAGRQIMTHVPQTADPVNVVVL